jgi:DNA-binding NtrC family response regulator
MVTVMITGESGSAGAGGPCTAQAFTAHQRTVCRHQHRPFPRTCKVSCLATSAVLSRVPKPCGVAAEQAEGGTLFLDDR